MEEMFKSLYIEFISFNAILVVDKNVIKKVSDNGVDCDLFVGYIDFPQDNILDKYGIFKNEH